MRARRPLNIVLAGPGLEPVAAELRKLFRRNGDAIFYELSICMAPGLRQGRSWRAIPRPEASTRCGYTICDAVRRAIRWMRVFQEDMVMKNGGWTKAMFSRYNVANKDRLRAAMENGGRHLEKLGKVVEQGGTR